eukprot:scaffold305597_cov24-Tisochrysis_lutea.AAC.3
MHVAGDAPRGCIFTGRLVLAVTANPTLAATPATTPAAGGAAGGCRDAARWRWPLLVVPPTRLWRCPGVAVCTDRHLDRHEAAGATDRVGALRRDGSGEVDGLHGRGRLRSQPRLLARSRAEKFLLACAVSSVGIVEADQDEAVARPHLVACVLYIAVVHEAIAALWPDEDAVHVARHRGEIGSAATKLIL